MAAPDGFVAFILTHRRPNRVLTYRALRSAGYTGPILLVVDSADPTVPEYVARYGDEVVVFDLAAARAITDAGDNFGRGSVLFARNACFDIAEARGYSHFIELDDDYRVFEHRYTGLGDYRESSARSLDVALGLLIKFADRIGAASVALAQNGDFIGGGPGQATPRTRRKAMNSFICSVARRFSFHGTMNDDVNTYVAQGRAGALFLTVLNLSLAQGETQANAGGLTELYLDLGTYVKSFYSVMYAPSCVQIGTLAGNDGQGSTAAPRIHHAINWRTAVPKILAEKHRKPRQDRGSIEQHERDAQRERDQEPTTGPLDA